MTILLVDDDRGFLNSMEVCLSSSGRHVVSAGSGPMALDVFRHSMKTTPCITLVITDLLIPGMSGVDLILTARRRYPVLKFILMTAYGNSGVRKTASEARINRYIEKPFTPGEMLDAIATLDRSDRGKRERP